MGLTDTEKRVIDGIDHEGLKDFLGELIAARSDGGNETAAQKLMKSKLIQLGFNIDEWQLDFNELSKHRDYNMSIPRNEGVGIVGTLGEDKRTSLILCGHIDTVSPGDYSNWDSPPFKATLKNGNIYGRGSCDMKGGIACAVYATKAILDSGLKLKGKLIFESTIGEEDGSPGALATGLRGYKANAGIVIEPTETKIAPQVSGAMSFKVTIKGKSVHACVKDEGVSAIDKFMVINKGLLELEKERNRRVTAPLFARYETPFALNIGKIEGGQWPGTVPETLSFEARIGVAINESLTQTKEEIEKRIREISEKDPWLKDHQPRVEWNGYEFAPSAISVDHPIVVALNDAYMDTFGETPVYEGMTYASDARHLQNIAKTPTVVFGPGDIRNAHGPNEYVSISDLEKTIKTLAITIMRYLNVDE